MRRFGEDFESRGCERASRADPQMMSPARVELPRAVSLAVESIDQALRTVAGLASLLPTHRNLLSILRNPETQ